MNQLVDLENKKLREWLQYELDHGTEMIEQARKSGTLFGFVSGLMVGFLVLAMVFSFCK